MLMFILFESLDSSLTDTSETNIYTHEGNKHQTEGEKGQAKRYSAIQK